MADVAISSTYPESSGIATPVCALARNDASFFTLLKSLEPEEIL